MSLIITAKTLLMLSISQPHYIHVHLIFQFSYSCWSYDSPFNLHALPPPMLYIQNVVVVILSGCIAYVILHIMSCFFVVYKVYTYSNTFYDTLGDMPLMNVFLTLEISIIFRGIKQHASIYYEILRRKFESKRSKLRRFCILKQKHSKCFKNGNDTFINTPSTNRIPS